MDFEKNTKPKKPKNKTKQKKNKIKLIKAYF